MTNNRHFFLILLFFIPFVDCLSDEIWSEAFDCTTVDFNEDNVEFMGVESFVWHEFITHEGLDSHSPYLQVVNAPSRWIDQFDADFRFNSLNYGTYLFKILLPESVIGKKMTLLPEKSLGHAFEMYVNGVLCANTGRVGRSLEDPMYVASREMHVKPFVADTAVLEVHVLVTDFQDNIGGVTNSMFLGTESVMRKKQERAIAIDCFVIISLFVLGLFHLVIYLVNHFDVKSLYFALAAMVFSIDYSFRDAMCFFVIFPDTLFVYYDAIRMTVICLLPIATALLFYILYPTFIQKGVLSVIIVTSLIFAVLSIFGSVYLRHFIIKPNFVYVLCVVLYLCYNTCRLLKSKLYGRGLLASAFLICGLCVINETLNSLHLVDTRSVMHYGLVIFVFLHSILYSKLAKKEYDDTVILARELDELNSQLSNKVQMRTEELSQTFRKLTEYNDFQEGMTHMIIHDIKGPLMQVINIDVKEKDFPHLRHAAQTMLCLIQNLLDLYRYNDDEVTIVPTTFDISTVIEEVLNDLDFQFAVKALKVKVVYTDVFEGKADIQVFKRVLVNFLSNAIRYSPVEGTINIRLLPIEGDMLKVLVSNQGPALGDFAKERIFLEDNIQDTAQDRKYNTSGLGLHLSKKAIDAHNGKIGVESDGVQGVDFWFTLPGFTVIGKTEVCKILVNTVDQDCVLSSSDIDVLRPYVLQLSKLEVYDTSGIDTILSSIRNRSFMVERWVNDVEKACYLLDEEKLLSMLNLVTDK